MTLPIWIPDALRSEQILCERVFWRCVEGQHVVSTLQLVDTLEDQTVLEEMLEESKPPVPSECWGLHYLYKTPFRYGLYPYGSRFRRAGQTPGVYYVSEAPDTAIIETAFHLLLFYAESPGTPFPSQPTEQTAFDVPIKTGASIDLTAEPFVKAEELWTHLSDYEPCQRLEEAARAEGVELIRYASVRDPEQKPNAALLTCAGFAATQPSETQSWQLLLNSAGVHAIRALNAQRFSLSPETFKADPRLSMLLR